jgi:phosphoribosylanthranilate isomerase
MARTRIKICGITRPEDAALAMELGADFIGLNFVGGPRQIGIDVARCLVNSIHNDLHATKPIAVGLTCAAAQSKGEVPSAIRIKHDTGIQTFQIYEDELVRTYRHPNIDMDYWYVVHVASRDLTALRDLAIPNRLDGSNIAAVLLDTAATGKLGGTGRAFDWHWIAEAREKGELAGLPPIILAGGLNPGNVAEAIRIARPFAVDVSSGVEVPGKPGIKDPVKMRDFIQAVQGA